MNRRLVVLAAVLAPIALHVGTATGRLLVRDVEVAVDVSEQSNGAVAWVYHGNGTAIRLTENAGRLEAIIPASRERPADTRLSYRFDAQSRRLSDVLVDGAPLEPRRVITLTDHLPPKTIFEFVIVKIPRWGAARIAAMAGLSLGLWALLFALFAPVITRRRAAGLGGALTLFTYSAAWRKHIRPRDVAIVMGVVLLTTFVYVGCDAEAIYHVFRIAGTGADVYQFQVNFKAHSTFGYPPAPYNPLLIEFWSLFDRVWAPLFGRAPAIANQIYLQILLCKLVNAGLLVLTALSLISFADEEGLIRGGRVRLAFYLSVFNPVLFYVAVLFVQFDTAPLYFATLGVLMAHRFERHGLLGPLFIAIGCAMKAQNILLFPTAFAAFAYNAATAPMARAARARILVGGLGVMGAILLAFEVMHLRLGMPEELLLSNFEQVQRIWLNVFAFTAVTYVFLTIAAVVLMLLFFVYQFRAGLESRTVIAASLLAGGAIVTVYNATHLHTPSTLLQLGAALTLVLLLEPDPLRRVLFSASAVTVVLYWCVTAPGDIGRAIPGSAGLFSQLEHTLKYAKWVRFVSLFHTINFAGLIAYVVVFWRRSRQLFDGAIDA